MIDTQDQYVYILINPAMPGLLKIGKTNRMAFDRANEISSATGVPTKFHVAYEIKVKNCDSAEKVIHKKFENYRVDKNREFFALPLDKAIYMMNDVILENNLDVENIKIHPYKFRFQVFSDSGSLAHKLFKDEDNWELAKIHFQKGYVQDWLKKKKEYNALIFLENAHKENNSVAFLLSVVIHSLIPDEKCTFLEIEIDKKRQFVPLFLAGSVSMQKILLYGDLLDYYKGYLFAKKLPDDPILKTLKFISNNGNNALFENKLKTIKLLSEWYHNKKEYPHSGSIHYNDIGFLLKKSRLVIFFNEYLTPKELQEMYEDPDKYLDLCKVLHSSITLNITREYISKKEFSEITSSYILPLRIEVGLFFGSLEQYKNAVSDLKSFVDKYPTKEILYQDYLFNETFEKALKNGQDIPLVKKDLLANITKDYFIPDFIIDGLKSHDVNQFKWAATSFDMLRFGKSENQFVPYLFELYKLIIEFVDVTEDGESWIWFRERIEHEIPGFESNFGSVKPENVREFLTLFYEIVFYHYSYDANRLLISFMLVFGSSLFKNKKKLSKYYKEMYELILYCKTNILLNYERNDFLIKKVEIISLKNQSPNYFITSGLFDFEKEDFMYFLFVSAWFKQSDFPKKIFKNLHIPDSTYIKLSSSKLTDFFNGMIELGLMKEYENDVFHQSLLVIVKPKMNTPFRKVINELIILKSLDQDKIFSFNNLKKN